MRVLTVRQPWAWALIHGGKDVENRTRNIAGDYRGPVAIHAGRRVEHDDITEPRIRAAWQEAYGWDVTRGGLFETGTIVGVVDLIDVHVEERGGRCSHWAEIAAPMFPPLQHLVTSYPRSFGFLGESPIRADGKLGLWKPDAELKHAITTTLDQIGRRASTTDQGGD